MKVVYNWLKEFVDISAAPEELASRLALSGTNIGSVEHGPYGAVIEAEISSNRPDCLGHLGVARELSAVYKLPLKLVLPRPAESGGNAGGAARVEIRAPELCGRFTARILRGVAVRPSPKWLKDRLEASGVASINNIVDVTNYVMLELGHPLHAFDYDLLRDHQIVVRSAQPKEKIRTLDGVERQLEAGFCVIADGEGDRAVGIGGIMGGSQTEISFSTRNVLVECAWFEPVAIRRAARNLKLHTEASTRFGRGADAEMAELASRRAAELILQLAGGELLSGLVDVYPGKREPKKIPVTRAEILRVMGADVPDREVESALGALGFAPRRVDPNRGAQGSLLAAWECTQPSWRTEVEREIDLIEEIARIHGLDRFSPRLPAARQGASRLPHHRGDSRLRERLVGLGYREILTIPLVASGRDELFRPPGVCPVRLANPLSEEAGLLRSTGLVTLGAAIEWNLNHGQRSVRLFEIGRRYRLEGTQARETAVLCLGITGENQEKKIEQPSRPVSFADLKGDLDRIGELCGGLEWEEGGPDWLQRSKRGLLRCGGELLGAAGQLAKRVAEPFKLRQEVYLAELELDPFYAAWERTQQTRRYEPLPRYPAVERDFSLLLAEGVRFSQVSGAIGSLRLPELISVEATDLYRGKNVPSGKYSLLVRVTFQSREATLTEAQISDSSARIVAVLEKELGAELRTG